MRIIWSSRKIHLSLLSTTIIPVRASTLSQQMLTTCQVKTLFSEPSQSPMTIAVLSSSTETMEVQAGRSATVAKGRSLLCTKANGTSMLKPQVLRAARTRFSPCATEIFGNVTIRIPPPALSAILILAIGWRTS